MINFIKTISSACFLVAVATLPAMAQSSPAFTSSTQSCLRFEDILKLSAERDPSVIIAKAQESEADAEIKEAKSLFRPQISAFGRSGFGDTGVIDSSISNQLGVRASQRVFDFGDSKYAREAANSGFEASLQDTRQAQLQAAQAVDNLLSRGAATRTERASVASQLADADAFVLELKFRQEQALTQIQIDTGTTSPLCNSKNTQGIIKQRMALLESPETATQIALDKSPNIQALDKRADSQDAIRKREKRSRLPIINIVATGSYSSVGGFDQFEFRDRIGVDVSVPLYSGNAIGARNQRASARYSIARGQLLDAERQLRKDVSIGYRRILSLESQLMSRQEVEKQTRLQFEAAEIEQGAGAKTLRDLIEIRLEYEQAGFQRIRTKYDLMRQQLQLLTLTAGILS